MWLKIKYHFLFYLLLIPLAIQAIGPPLISDQMIFTHLTADNGLMDNRVRGIAQDNYGFMWFGSRTGITRYNGVTTTQYDSYYYNGQVYDLRDIREILCDSYGTIWAAGRESVGIIKYNRDRDRFESLTDNNNNKVTDSSSGIALDNDGSLWFTDYEQIVHYFPKNDRIVIHHGEPNASNSLPVVTSEKILVDKIGNVWIGTRNEGLVKFDVKNNQFYIYNEQNSSIAENSIERIYEDPQGNIWIGHFNNGISKFKWEDGTFTKYFPDLNNPPSGRVRGFLIDHNDDFWVGTQAGLFLFDRIKGSFYQYASYNHPISQLRNNSIQSMYIDDHQGLWLGTFAGGVSYANLNKSGFAKYEFPPEFGLDKYTNSIVVDGGKNIWLGTLTGGLVFLNRTTGRTKSYLSQPNRYQSLKNNSIRRLLLDKDNLYIAYFRGGLTILNVKTQSFKHFQIDLDKIDNSEYDITELLQDPGDEHILWVGTSQGLFRFHKKTEKFFRFNTGQNSSVNSLVKVTDQKLAVHMDSLFIIDLKNNSFDTHDIHQYVSSQIDQKPSTIKFIHVDQERYLWCYLSHGDIVRVDLASQEIIKHTIKGRIKGDLLGILGDDHGNLWISSNYGIYELENIVNQPEQLKIIPYALSENVKGMDYIPGAYARDNDGEMYFGGITGFTSFYPSQIKINPFPPKVAISKFLVENHPVNVGDTIHGNHIFYKNIFDTDSIQINHKIRVFTLTFNALHYESPQNNQLAYKMEGFDNEWHIVNGASWYATYSNMPAGPYTFRVMAANKDGVWGEDHATIFIRIIPPFWQTWKFYVILVLFGLFLVIGFTSLRTERLRKDKAILEKEVSLAKKELEQQLVEIEKQKENLELANSEIKALYSEIKESIKAGLAIQKSFFPTPDYLSKFLSEYFIFDKPKDVISGDFYWFTSMKGFNIIAVADCTGHGVSGAFMSIIGNHLLNQAVRKVRQISAAAILDFLHTSLIQEFKTYDQDLDLRNGMDISICVLDQKKSHMQFAGAINPMYHIRNKNLVQYKADRYSIGSVFKNQGSFHNHEIDLLPGDMVFLFTDGYADQLGGPDNNKYMYPNFRKLLLKISDKPVWIQHKELSKNLENWQRGNEQIDDILILGFRI